VDDKQNDPRYNFYARPTIEELLAQQGTKPVKDLSIFHGAWPEDENVEDFIAAYREWRGHGKADKTDRAA
jgi:hypothetical protein